jgi:hypothetical protein
MSGRFQLHPDLRLTALAGEGVALHLGSRRYFTVNGTGLDLLEALKTPRTVGELTEVLTARYDVTDEQARASALAFVERCRAAGLLQET